MEEQLLDPAVKRKHICWMCTSLTIKKNKPLLCLCDLWRCLSLHEKILLFIYLSIYLYICLSIYPRKKKNIVWSLIQMKYGFVCLILAFNNHETDMAMSRIKLQEHLASPHSLHTPSASLGFMGGIDVFESER